jgi:hypothetical protein
MNYILQNLRQHNSWQMNRPDFELTPEIQRVWQANIQVYDADKV